MNILQITDLTVCFGGGKAVDNVSFDIGENEVVGLVGESGSGKTITAYSIMGILPKEAHVTSGAIKFADKNLLAIPEKAMRDIRGKSISIVFQEPFTSLNPVLTVGYQVEEALVYHKNISKKSAKEETMRLLKKAQMKDPERMYHEYPHRLSGGERQRAVIAMAIALGPKLLIADEPTTALDATIQAEILKLFLQLKKDLNLSILFITHDFGIINEVADRVIVMRGGKIIESGKKNEIMDAPKHEYTRALVEAGIRISQKSKVKSQKFKSKVKSEESEIFIEVKGLSKTFSVERGAFKKEVAKIEAVKNVNMQIEKGKVVGLIGESGCGKSTLGRLILGLEKPDSGEILLGGDIVKQYPKKIREMLQIVFQDPFSSLDPRMRMKDIVLEGARLLRCVNPHEEGPYLEHLLKKVQISPNDKSKYPHQFSGGQRQRIAMARALAVNPKFLVLDEPLSNLDVLIQKDLLNLFKALKGEYGLTYLFISHDLRVVREMADCVYLMRNGEITEDTTAPNTL